MNKLRVWYVTIADANEEIKTVKVVAPNFIDAGIVSEHMYDAITVLNLTSTGKYIEKVSL